MDHYDAPPSRKQLKKSGTEDWFNEAISEQKRRDAEISGVLGDVGGDLAARKADLLDALALPPDEEEGELPPDLFAQERDRVRQDRKGLGGMFAESEETRAEKESLRNLFGK